MLILTVHAETLNFKLSKANFALKILKGSLPVNVVWDAYFALLQRGHIWYFDIGSI